MSTAEREVATLPEGPGGAAGTGPEEAAGRGAPAGATAQAGAGIRILEGWRRLADRPIRLPDCTLVIATYRRPVEVVTLLDALAELPDPPGEVVVVDGSPDGETARSTEERAQRGRLPFDLVHVASPRGLTRQRNVGIDASRGEFIFFLDDDCIPEPGYFTALREALVSDPAVGGVRGTFIPRARSKRAELKIRLGLIPDVAPGMFSATACSRPTLGEPPFTGCRPVETLPGGSMAFRREVFGRHRFSYFFDGYAQGEDLEMSVRVSRDWKLLWSGDAQFEHRHAPGGRPNGFAKGRMEVRNRHFIWKRHVARVRVRDRIRFWLDVVAFSVAYDVAKQIRHPLDGYPGRHALGILAGAVECVVRPAHYEEPPARPEYGFAFRILEPTSAA